MNNQEKYYKKRNIICFYDENDEHLLYMFDNVIEILKFQKKDITKKNAKVITTEIYRAINKNNHRCKFLTGKPMTCHIIDIKNK